MDAADLEKKIADGSTVIYKGDTLVAMKTNATTAFNGDTQKVSAVDAQKPQVISAKKAYDLIQQELGLASSVGATKTSATFNPLMPSPFVSSASI